MAWGRNIVRRGCRAVWAGVLLVVFVASQALCFDHCHRRAGQTSTTLASCRGDSPGEAAPACSQGACHRRSSSKLPPSPVPPSRCSTLKQLHPPADSHIEMPARSPMACADLPEPLRPARGVERALLTSFRLRASADIPCCTPEVSLDPAVRSLAPPNFRA